MKLGIKREYDNCVAAFAASPDCQWAWCCHHEKLAERLTEPAINRINYILKNKPEKEQALRFRNFRPVSQSSVELVQKLTEDYEAKKAPLWADYMAKVHSLYAAYEAKFHSLYEAFEVKRASLSADYWAKRAPLTADYWASLLHLYKADVPNGTWNGQSIFS